MLVAAVGCDKNKNHDHMSKSTMKDNTMASMDVCPHCAGVQHGTADGKCEVCGMPITKANMNAK
jgi:hypothetical protein